MNLEDVCKRGEQKTEWNIRKLATEINDSDTEREMMAINAQIQANNLTLQCD